MRTIALLAVSPAVLCSSIKRAEPAPLITRDEDIGGLIANKYIVKFKEDSSVSVFESAISILPETPDYVFENTIRGFSATLDATSLASLRDHPNVRSLFLFACNDGETMTEGRYYRLIISSKTPLSSLTHMSPS